ncbi:bile acid:sodium symporter family protein [Kocuria sp. M1R5S2]|uniref:bile acid:sodium symporter family protein n=1 Tax=Kocuria rhizosphaerae TaxID=3376285 RepID=UPI003794D6A4
MDLQTVTDAVGAVVVPLFAVMSMVAVGLGHTVGQFLGPLRDVRLVAAGLVTNFVVAPLVALAVVTLFGVPDDVRVALMVLACAAGAPFALQLSKLARADMAVSSSLLAVMLLATVVYMPLVLPVLLPGVAVGPRGIAAVLLLTMLLPLLGAVLVRQFAPRIATALQATAGRLSLAALVVMLANQLLADHRELAGLLGTGAIAAITTSIALNFGLGWLLGGPRGRGGPVLGISASQRNMGAAIVVVVANFGDSTAAPTVVLAGFLALIVLLPVARWLGRPGAVAPPAPGR